MKKFYSIVIITTLLAILSAYLLISQECLRQPFSLIKDLLSIIQIVISVFIVYLLYDRFGTSKKILDKQNEIIIEFVEELKKVQLEIYDMGEKGVKTTIHTTISKDLSFAKTNPIGNKIALFHSDQFYSELSRLNELVEHPLFPIELKSKTDIFKFGIMKRGMEINNENFGYISFKHGLPKEGEVWMYPYDGDMKVNDYLTKIEKAISELELWINKESSIKIKLNLK